MAHAAAETKQGVAPWVKLVMVARVLPLEVSVTLPVGYAP
jgi:hypothetical protein